MQQQVATSVFHNLGPALVRMQPQKQLQQPLLLVHQALKNNNEKSISAGSTTTTTGVRYSLQALADQRFTPDVAHKLIGSVAHRLSIQTDACSKLLEKEEEAALMRRGRHLGHSSSLAQKQHQFVIQDNLKRLLYIHKDTLRLCRQVECNRVLFDRWSRADRFVVKATAEEVRSRHAAGLERWVDAVVAQDATSSAASSSAFEGDVGRILERRLGIHLLCDHLVKLSATSTSSSSHCHHGYVSVGCDLQDAIEEAHAEASALCDAHWQVVPELDFCGTNLQATVILPWLHHAIFEVLKNAMCASVRKVAQEANVAEGSSSSANLLPPPIKIHVCRHNLSNMIVINVIDRGTGIKLSSSQDMERLLFGIGQSSALSRWDRLKEQQSFAAVRSPLCSLGVGLPISRMLMRHFGGDVQVSNNPDGGGGCLARILLPCDALIFEPRITVEP